jgi:hypothetical protein
MNLENTNFPSTQRKNSDRNKNDVCFAALERHGVTATDLVLDDFLFADLGEQKLGDVARLLVAEQRDVSTISARLSSQKAKTLSSPGLFPWTEDSGTRELTRAPQL